MCACCACVRVLPVRACRYGVFVALGLSEFPPLTRLLRPPTHKQLAVRGARTHAHTHAHTRARIHAPLQRTRPALTAHPSLTLVGCLAGWLAACLQVRIVQGVLDQGVPISDTARVEMLFRCAAAALLVASSVEAVDSTHPQGLYTAGSSLRTRTDAHDRTAALHCAVQCSVPLTCACMHSSAACTTTTITIIMMAVHAAGPMLPHALLSHALLPCHPHAYMRAGSSPHCCRTPTTWRQAQWRWTMRCGSQA